MSEYMEYLEAEAEKLNLEEQSLEKSLEFLRAVLSPDATVNDPSHKLMAELLTLDPDIDLYELVVATTEVSVSKDGKEFTETLGYKELVELLDDEGLLVERGRSVVDRFFEDVESFNQTVEKHGGDYLALTPDFLSNEIGRVERLGRDLQSAQPHRFIPAFQEIEASDPDSTAYSGFVALEPPRISDPFTRSVDAYKLDQEPKPEAFDPQAPTPAPAPATPAWEGAGETIEEGQAVAAAQSRLDRLREERAAEEAKTGYVLPEDGLINGRPAGEDKDELDARIAEAEAEAERLEDELSTPGPSGPPRLSAADIQAANEDEVHALLSTQFGGFAFFLQRNKTELMVGLNADGMVVAADDPTAVSAKNVLDVIVEQGITDPNRVTGILQNTEWWKNTDAVMRQFDANYGEMSEPEKLEFLEPVLDTLRDEARFLGFEMSTDRARELAVKIAREGEAGDSEYIRGLMVAEGEFNAAETELSDFGAARDQIEALSRSYYVPIGTEEAAQWAEDVYVGTKSATQVEQYFKEMAINKFPTLKNAIEGGLTADQYFAPYKYEIEKMLDRPNVDLYEEFGDVIEYMPDTGGDTPRPMTLGEVRKYVRGLDEWQTSTSGQDSARSLAFAIGKTFGEVA